MDAEEPNQEELEHLAAHIVRSRKSLDSVSATKRLSPTTEVQLRKLIDELTEIAVSGIPVLSGRGYAQISFKSGPGGLRPLYIDLVDMRTQLGAFVRGRVKRIVAEPGVGALEITPRDLLGTESSPLGKSWDLVCSVANGRLVGSFSPSQPATTDNEESFGTMVLHFRRRMEVLSGSYSRYRDDPKAVVPHLTTANQERPLVWVAIDHESDLDVSLASSLQRVGIDIQATYASRGILPIDGESL